LWKFILDHPDEMGRGEEGGLYFSGSSPWGNRLATERAETQNMLIDACKMMLTEYHLDGFRFDATHSMYIDHSFLQRLANELQDFKPGVILIAENLPNEPDLNREGYNGFAQWCDFFHDTIKSFLREGKFEGTDNKPEALGDVFYFSKGRFAAHTNNVINYCESHDEHSVAHEVSFVNNLNTPQAKERKSRLGLFATMVALGQPMIYMGQEFAVERPRNVVYFDFPKNLDDSGFFQWASRLIRLRRRYPGLKLHGYNPIAEGEFTWLLGPWMDARHGGGKRVLGWRAKPNGNATDEMVILLNMENHPIEVDIPFGTPGYWVRLATMDYVNDIEPDGNNSIDAEGTLQLEDGNFGGFTLPDSFGFIYKWQQSL
jgi:1,4-alpha-glucan branching enzyme